MRYIVCAALLCGLVGAQEQANISQPPPHGDGIFFVNGVDYHFISGSKYTVVIAAHAVVNRKFLGVKIRILNNDEHSVTVRPEDLKTEDAVSGRSLEGVSGTELAKRMGRPYNWSRFAVNTATGGTADTESDTETVDQQRTEMLHAMQQMASKMANGPASMNAMATAEPSGVSNVVMVPGSKFSDEVSQLRSQESSRPDVLMQLQRQNSPDYIARTSLLANTIPPGADLEGVLYYPLGKLARDPAASKRRTNAHIVRVTVPVGGDKFQFVLAVE